MGRESARRKHGQFRKDRHALAFERRAPCEVAGQRCGEIFSAFKGSAEWVANAYMLMLGALILAGGSAGDRFGRRRVFALGVGIFTAASVACGLAPNTAALIAARAAHGAGGALLIPGSLAVISAAFPADERGKAIGTWAGFSALTTAVGPVLGGWLVDALSWRAIFFINVPIALLTLGLAFWHVPESRDASDDGTVDWRGTLLAVLGLAGLAYGLTAASDFGWMYPVVPGVLLGRARSRPFRLVRVACTIPHDAARPVPVPGLQRRQRGDLAAQVHRWGLRRSGQIHPRDLPPWGRLHRRGR
jgi:MFS family permease